MSTFILVHGAWHGGWCWQRIVTRLEKAGHTVHAPDLQGLGQDQTPIGKVSLAAWTRQITDLIDQCKEPVVLVGHSRGGLVISEVAEQRPECIRTLVYLTAFLLKSGEMLHGSPAATDPQSLVGPHMVIAEDHQSATIKTETLCDAFYAQCDEEAVQLARAMLRPEPLAPLATPLQLTDERFGKVRRVFIECLRDRAITIQSQRAMHARLPCAMIFSLDTDHSPFLSRPDELSAILMPL